MIVITHRKLCTRPFLEQIDLLASGGPEMVILREKDLSDGDLAQLASDCLGVCRRHGVSLSVNTNLDVASELGIGRVHVPIQVARERDLTSFDVVGVSVHSPTEAEEAQNLGADYLIAGHVFPTACKIGEPRGTGYIREVCSVVEIPVYGVGGITPENMGRVIEAGAEGVCVMSSAMTADDPAGLVRSLRRT
ncbi:MAG: thiamine phosphate synthase [Candidatus Methanomethylophilaceae archaeon]